MKQLTSILIFLSFNAFAQKSAFFRIDSLPTEGVLLDKNWKFHAGDNPDFAKAEFDDSGWQSINPTLDVHDTLPQIPRPSGICWFRLRMTIHKNILKTPLALRIGQSGASEIYENGVFVRQLGLISSNPNKVKAFDPLTKPMTFNGNNDTNIVLAIRYTLQPNVNYTTILSRHNPALQIQLNDSESAFNQYANNAIRASDSRIIRRGIFFIVFLLCLSYYMYDPQQKANLYFSFYALFNIIFDFLATTPNDVDKIYYYHNAGMGAHHLSAFLLLSAFYFLFNQKRTWIYWSLMGLTMLSILVNARSYHFGNMLTSTITGNLINIEIIRITFKSIKIKTRGAWIIAAGGICFAVFWIAFLSSLPFAFNYWNTLFFNTIYTWGDVIYNMALLSIPISVSVYMGLDIANTNRTLRQKLVEVEALSAEKHQILATQNETLEQQVTERTAELAHKQQNLEKTLNELRVTQTQLVEKEKIATSAAVQLKELDAVKTRLYTNITHEFRTPLTVILGMAQQAMDKPHLHLQEGLKMITRNGQNLLDLVNQMLDLNKLESGKLDLHYQQVDVVNFLKYIVESLHSLAENKGIKLHFLTDLDTLAMDIEENRLQQVVSNLLSNAVKFTPKGGNIYMTVGRQNGTLSLKVKDTGVGISEEQLPYIFDRFYQADATATRYGEGTGIGLSLTRELVKLMNGTIAVKSHLHKGSEFEVTLPITHISDIKENKAETFKILKNTDVFLDNNITTIKNKIIDIEKSLILIADDNADVRAYIASCLAADYHLLIAKDGQECQDMAFDKTPDLIISDVMMPFKDGFEVCKTLKTDERTSHIPIIMLTAKADMSSKLEGLERGADAYLMKPFNKEELLLRIKNLLELRKQLQQYYLSTVMSANSPSGAGGTEGGNTETEKMAQSKNNPIISGLDNAFVIKVKTTVEAHLNDTGFDIEKLSRALALSISQVNRKLTALTGLSTNNFMRYVRLIKSKELLLHSGFSVTAIAYDSGFNDPAYFIRVFKQEFGVTPQVWREQNLV